MLKKLSTISIYCVLCNICLLQLGWDERFGLLILKITLLTPDSKRFSNIYHIPYTLYLPISDWGLVIGCSLGIWRYIEILYQYRKISHTQIHQGVLTIKLQGFHTFKSLLLSPCFPLFRAVNWIMNIVKFFVQILYRFKKKKQNTVTKVLWNIIVFSHYKTSWKQ